MNGTIISGFGLLDAYTVESFGNGWAYTITRKDDKDSIWLQDDDALEFRAQFDKAEENYMSEYSYTVTDLCNEYFYL